MKKIITKLFTALLLSLFFLPFFYLNAQEDTRIAISFTGIGCPHCAKVAPQLHKRVQNGSLILIEYEMYKSVANSQVFNTYIENYNLELGIPQILFDKDLINSGDSPIIDNLDSMIEQAKPNTVYLSDGSSVSFENFDLNSLNRYPIIYSKDRVVVRKSITRLTEQENEQIKNFIFQPTIESALQGLEGKSIKPELLSTPGENLVYEHAIKINGWILQWNGIGIDSVNTVDNESSDDIQDSNQEESITVGRIVSLGLADSVNPCALSILALVLISIITYNPGKRKDILLAGLSFILSVLIMYLVYGILIVKAFELVQSIGSIREFLFGKLGLNLLLGIGATILGILGLKDFLLYKPGSVGTEMPLFLRPKVNKLIAKVTSPWAAFFVGLFVTLFLLPCTIGPYIILGGLLATEGVISAIPSLLLYNVIFVLPMLAVTLIVYFGTSKVEDVKDWKEKNVRYMHLVSGILLLTIGILMILGKF